MTQTKTIENIDFTLEKGLDAEYESCTFVNCKFYNLELFDIKFTECTFQNCDLSLVKLTDTVLADVKFENCKLLGTRFEECNDFLLAVSFDNCQMKLASFFKLKLKKTSFINCNLEEADFSETILSGSTFDNCDLKRAIFDRTNLEKVDLITSINYSIDPEKNFIKKAKFSRHGVVGLLDKYDIEIK